MLTIERMGAIAFDAFCRSITKCSEQGDPNHYFTVFDDMVDTDIQRAWIASAAAVIVAMEYEKK